MSRFDLRSLQHFTTVAESGGFARAARQLNLSQPSLSRSIAQLEHAVGSKLFDRSTRGTTITDIGRRFLPHAVAVLNEVRRAGAIFENSEFDAVEQVRVGVSPSVLYRGIPRALDTLISHAGDFGITLTTGTREVLADRLRARDIDIAVCVVAPFVTEDPANLDGLTFEEIDTEMMIPAAMTDHPIFAHPPSLETAAKYGWAIPHQMSISYRFETAFFRRNLPNPAQRLNCVSMGLLLRGIREWGLIGMAPASLLKAGIADGSLKALPLDELHFPCTVSIITPRGVERSSAIQLFADTIRQTIHQKSAPYPYK